MIQFFDETGDLASLLEIADQMVPVIERIMNDHGKEVVYINVIFLNDEELLQINKDYLLHDYYTDIITFNYSEAADTIEGELYISLPRIKENAVLNKVDFKNELFRVVIHGNLHLAGYNDQTKEDKNNMQILENQYIEYVCST